MEKPLCKPNINLMEKPLCKTQINLIEKPLCKPHINLMEKPLCKTHINLMGKDRKCVFTLRGGRVKYVGDGGEKGNTIKRYIN